MKITNLKINHLVNPVGYGLENTIVSYVVEEARGKKQKEARIIVAEDPGFENIVYDTGLRADIDSRETILVFEQKPSTRYFWKVFVRSDAGETGESEIAFFETPKDDTWQAAWITSCTDRHTQVTFLKNVDVKKSVKKARMYMVGLGLYEFYLNGEKQGDEVMLPGFCNYNAWIPYQTFPVHLNQGNNRIEVMTGDGWYKGWYGLRQNHDNYGDRLALLAELHVWYEDGTKEIIPTDTSWMAKKSPVTYDGIYPGEVFDLTVDDSELFQTEKLDLGYDRLTPRLDPPILIHEHIRPIEVIHTPAGESVLDMGQNMVGWLQFHTKAKKGTKLFFQFGEILQEGNFYNGNLRTAKAEFTYVSDGRECDVRQHFTFYGFRYVKVTGWDGEVNPEDFRGLVIHSDMEQIGHIETAKPEVNQLIHNVWWGQKGNFIDIPTDCPQRDERYGWTGDAQIFSGTACFNADTYAFYTKYGKDVYSEQRNLGGSVPDVVPVCNYPGDASTAWGEAATIIPWNVYLHFGDPEILRRQFPSMRAWVDYMKRQDDKYGAKRLWLSGFHYGDWLALDGKVKGGVYGATDPNFIASAYYYYSTNIVAKTAGILGLQDENAYYTKLASEIYDAFEKEYFTPAGKLAVNTMTAYVVVLYMGLCPDYAKDEVKKGLLQKLQQNRYHLETGFVGTPYLCRVLSNNGMNDLAYHLLLEKGFPGWLYEVSMGATTIWERWNSVEPDGKISGTEMNSLNHYSYGSVEEWMYRDMLGIQPTADDPGFGKFILAPKPDYQIPWAKGSLRSAMGVIRSAWKIEKGKLYFRFTVPFGAEAMLVLPDADVDEIRRISNDRDGISDLQADGKNVRAVLSAGEYQFSYNPTTPYRKIYSIDSPFEELKENTKTRKILEEDYFSVVPQLPFEKELYTFRELLNGPFTALPHEAQEAIDKRLREVE